MQNMKIKDRQGYKTFCDVMFVLLCAFIIFGIIAIGLWIANACFGIPWVS